LAVFGETGLISYRRKALADIGDVYFHHGQWQAAHDAYATAIEDGMEMLSSAYTEAGRKEHIHENRNLYFNDAYCLLRMGFSKEALLRIEQGKARLLCESLALSSEC
jgi:hypothetical protein